MKVKEWLLGLFIHPSQKKEGERWNTKVVHPSDLPTPNEEESVEEREWRVEQQAQMESGVQEWQ